MTIQCKVHFRQSNKGRKHLRLGAPTAAVSSARVPRIARLMALAIRFDDMLRRSEVRDYAELARLGHVSRARVTQIMNLLNLAADIQEEILFLPLITTGHDIVKEWQVRPIAAQPCWSVQRNLFFRELLGCRRRKYGVRDGGL